MARVVRESDQGTPAGADGTAFLVLAGAAVAALALAWCSINAGLWAAGEVFILNPVSAVIALATGNVPWNWASWTALIVVIVIIAIFIFLLAPSPKSPSEKVHARASKMMARPSELNGLTGKVAQEKATRLYEAADPKNNASTTGLLVGRTVAKPHSDIYMSWEDTAVVLAGQRMGKTQAYVTTSILSAPGPCVATANKRDVVDMTQAGRSEKGQVWLFDLQNIATDTSMDWWWNPLREVHDYRDARKLANYFASAVRSGGGEARKDPYFDTAAEEQLSAYIFAAAKADGDLLHVLEWLKNDTSETPVKILQAVGENAVAQSANANIHMNPKQKDGVFAMAANFLSVLNDRGYAAAVTPEHRAQLSVTSEGIHTDRGLMVGQQKPEFRVMDFASSKDTLYAMSVEGPDSPSALTTALVGQVIDAAQKTARKIPGGRLKTPMVCVLDEAANVVRLEELPSLYSYCGSQGILLMTFLQSRSQAFRVWGQEGFRAMMESSNLVIYGGGIKDKDFLAEISAMIGQMRVERTSTSRGSQTNYSTSFERQDIMGIDDLQALPSSHAVIMSSGNRPTLATKVFWSMSPFKEAVEESMRQAKAREMGTDVVAKES
ncbi:TraM recognition site of TraD and TraG (plasmid) [Corynebacterium faecale]|uniref:type IV secretory system conjugative DNA transfer family protein n=1 Tax=Corynebacterium faecale TaxID=1758466 RepID=UPI0025B294ED|nr:type IV secretory system conjugative DNA transfer family protein [Corynebacterium faecale]WJY93628.1 TraM recognition site of TraD and TraG [Corynebacterium faecale]